MGATDDNVVVNDLPELLPAVTPAQKAAGLSAHDVALGCTVACPCPAMYIGAHHVMKTVGTDALDKPIAGTTTSNAKASRHNGAKYKYAHGRGTVWICRSCTDKKDKDPKYREAIETELERKDARKKKHSVRENWQCPMFSFGKSVQFPGYGPCYGRKDC